MLAERLGVTPKAVNKWLNAESMPEDWRLSNLGTLLNCDPVWLREGGESPDNVLLSHSRIGSDETIGASTDDDLVEVPLLREIQNLQGIGKTKVVNDGSIRKPIPRYVLKQAGLLPEDVAVTYMVGNSMEPEIHEDSLLAVDLSDPPIRDGRFYVLNHHGMIRIRQLFRVPGGGVRLVAGSGVDYPDEHYSAEEASEQIGVIGRVFWQSSFM